MNQVWWIVLATLSLAMLSVTGPIVLMIVQFKFYEAKYPTIAHDHPVTYYLVKKFARLILSYGRVKYVVHGSEHRQHRDYVLIINHQSTFDGVIVNHLFADDHIGGIVKDELFHLPIIPFWMRARHLLPLNRENNREGIKTMLQAIDYAKAGQPMFIFPEGTRSQSKTMIPFRDGAFKLAEKSEKNISILVIHNAYAHSWFKPVTIDVEFLPVMTYEDYKPLPTVELSKQIHLKMTTAIERGL
jgi:1-acyl-sn-glycerol-3-phosphate acyltransferase